MENDKVISYLKKSVVTGIGKSILVTIVTLSLIPLTISQVGIDKYGMVMFAFTFSNAATLFDLGISKSVTLLLAKEEEEKVRNQIVSGGLTINLIVFSIISIIVFFIIIQDLAIFGTNFNQPQFKNYILIIGLAVLFISLIKSLSTAILEAYYLMHFINIGNTFSSVLLFGSLYLCSLITQELDYLLVVPIIPLLLTLVFYIVLIKFKTNIRLNALNRSVLKKITSVSFRFLNIGLVNSAVIPFNKYLLLFISGNSGLIGVFDIGIRIATSANNLLSSLSAPLFGIFSSSNNNKDIMNLVKKTTVILSIAVFLGAIVFYFIRIPIAQILDENNLNLIGNISFVLLLGICFTGIAEPSFRALLGQKKLKEAFVLKLIIPFLNLIFILILFRFETIYRISYALTVSYIIGSISIIAFFFKNRNFI